MDVNILKGKIIRVHDGDTPIVQICWLDVFKVCRVRMASMNAPELSNPDGSGIKARDYLASILTVGLEVLVQCYIVDNYGRPLGTIYLSQKATKSVNQMMIDSGNAVPMGLKTQIRKIKKELEYFNVN